MENLPIDTESINKTIDLVSESTEKTRKELDKITAKGVNKIAQLIWASPLGRIINLYIVEGQYKMEKALEELKSKYEEIPEEFRVEPSSYISLKGVNELTYSLEEEHLKKMFQNILISDMDSRKKNRILPSYIEIIKQLSKDDAEFLKLLYESDNNKGGIAEILIILKEKDETKGYDPLDEYIIYNYENKNGITKYNLLKLNKLVIDTLLMHRLIDVKFDIYLARSSAEEEYNTLFNSVKNNYEEKDNTFISYEKGVICITEFGKNFIDICLN